MRYSEAYFFERLAGYMNEALSSLNSFCCVMAKSFVFEGKVMGPRRVRKSILIETGEKVTNSLFGGEFRQFQGRNATF
jgi:hypothetical protein